VGPPPVGAARGEATRTLLSLPGWQVSQVSRRGRLLLVLRLHSTPPSWSPFPNLLSVIFFHSFENNETIRVGAQVEIGPMGMAPAAALVESPHLGQQVSVTRAKIVFRPQGRNRSKLGPPFGPLHTGLLGATRYVQCFWCAHMHICQEVSVALAPLTRLTGMLIFPGQNPPLPSKSR